MKFVDVPIIDVESQPDLQTLIETCDTPALLKNVSFDVNFDKGSGLTVDRLLREYATVKMPAKSTKNFFVGFQGSVESVMDSSPSPWHPNECTFLDLVKTITSGPNYLTIRSAKGSYSWDGQSLKALFAVPSDELIENIRRHTAIPVKVLPIGKPFQLILFLGSEGKNFGLHTDMFAEQFIVQHEGRKEFIMLLPEDISVLKPYKFLDSAKFYKSSGRSVYELDELGACLKATLIPGDVLFLPPWWWHEVKSVSPGPSLSITYRIHTEDSDILYRIIRDLSSLYERAKERPNIARHMLSFFAYNADLNTI
ncbi:MAG: cupin-like domain-containing protein [Methylococcaceae bacterium]|nr:cupin-like domain-containing protein [Methylococcaceae bacterium]